jgi:hypothetical protein
MLTDNPQIQYLTALAYLAAARIHRDERGETTEKVIITAIFAALALAVGAIIVAKVTGKAESIPTDGATGG